MSNPAFSLYITKALIIEKEYISIVLLLMVGFLCYIFLYGLFHMLKATIEEKLKLIIHSQIFNFHLINGEKLIVKLKSITSSGDFVVDVLNNSEYKNNEVLIYKLQIEKILYRTESTTETDKHD